MPPSFAQVASLLDASSVFLVVVTLVVFAIPVLIIFPPVPVECSDALGQTHSKVGVPERESRLRDQWTSTTTTTTAATIAAPANAISGSAAAAAAAGIIANGHVGESGQRQPTPSRPKLHSLHIYPIKSCRGIELTEATVLPAGLEHDRVFCLAQLKTKKAPRDPAAAASSSSSSPGAAAAADVEYWEVLTLRQNALMASIQVDLWVPDASKHSRQLGPMTRGDGDGDNDNNFLVVRFPWRDAGVKAVVQTLAAKLSRGLSATAEREFMLPLGFPSASQAKASGYLHAEVTLFRKVIPALSMATELPPELALYLGLEPRKLALFRLDPARRRQVFQCAPTREVAGYQPEIDFQDAYPLHLINLSSVIALESKIRKDADIEKLDARRFRPNIIVSGLPEYDEDDWRAVQFKAVSSKDQDSIFDVSCRTVRCKLPNVDPATSLRHKSEPDHALRRYREIDSGAPKKGCMGMQMCPLFSPDASPKNLQSTIRVGMEIVVLKRGAHHAL